MEPATADPLTLPTQPRLRLVYLDGLRGVAVGFIVLHHLYLRLCDPGETGHLLHGLPTLVLPGRLAVAVFIVLSGYSLMIPVARSADGRLPGGLGRYVRRRARRIVPPYQIALLASLLPLVPGLIGRPRGPGGHAAVDLSAASVVAHVLLVHNLSPVWAHQINGPLWSLATEWQIYFVFPLLLLPLWRAAGWAATVVVATALGMAAARVPGIPLAQASPWYLGLFAMGMAGCVINFSAARPRLPRASGLLVCVVSLFLAAFIGVYVPGQLPVFDAACGVAVAALLVDQTERARCDDGRSPVPLWHRTSAAFLECRTTVWLGTVSYSLYLIHQPLIVIVDTALRRATGGATTGERLAAGLLAPPVIGLAALLFHHMVERPFMPGRPVTPVQAARSAALEPAV